MKWFLINWALLSGLGLIAGRAGATGRGLFAIVFFAGTLNISGFVEGFLK